MGLKLPRIPSVKNERRGKGVVILLLVALVLFSMVERLDSEYLKGLSHRLGSHGLLDLD